MRPYSFWEFFCGGGMARAGLDSGWSCLFANDFDRSKARAYIDNWGDDALKCADVASLTPADIPGQADLVWSSFPCQDLSLAGLGGGLAGTRSGAFWPFWRLMQGLAEQGRAPRLIALENVRGALTSRGGADFRALCEALAAAGYVYGALVIDAVAFTPQSRPRLFLIGASPTTILPAEVMRAEPLTRDHPAALIDALDGLSPQARAAWRWWRLPEPPRRNVDLIDILETDPPGARWRTPAQTERLLSLMTPLHRARVEVARAAGSRQVGAVYRRTRMDATGARRQRAEVRFDGLAGCLRTPGGGSSRQTLLIIENGEVRSRLLSAREAARLMGLPESYRLPAGATEAYHLVGDGVVAPVVRALAENLFEPILRAQSAASPGRRAAAR